LDNTSKNEFVFEDFNYFKQIFFFGIENNMIFCDIDRKLPLYHIQKGKGYSSRLLHKFETQSKPL